MKIETYLLENGKWNKNINDNLDSPNTLVLLFGASNYALIENESQFLQSKFPHSIILGCSTAGEIYNNEFHENSLCVAVMKFEKTYIDLKTLNLLEHNGSFNSGKVLAQQFKQDNLKALFILSDGLNVNGSQLTKGINSILDNIIVTGGLAGDGANFTQTWLLVDGKPQANYLTAVGFYGDNIQISHGSKGGWNQFGINRMVTEAVDNVLYRLDDKPALEVYKTYLGENAKDLPSSGLLYPLMIKEEGYEESKVRTILAINEEEQSITFAGDIPNGSEVMFMRASFAELIKGAKNASDMLDLNSYNHEEAINIAISCVGRKLVLGQKVEDEIEAVMDELPENVQQIGYYSYGEISPLTNGKCDLHNQTMTLTLLWEK